jgi:hypothetical protein
MKLGDTVLVNNVGGDKRNNWIWYRLPKNFRSY